MIWADDEFNVMKCWKKSNKDMHSKKRLQPWLYSQAAHVDKVERTVAEALSQAAEKLAQFKHIHEVKVSLVPKKLHSLQ